MLTKCDTGLNIKRRSEALINIKKEKTEMTEACIYIGKHSAQQETIQEQRTANSFNWTHSPCVCRACWAKADLFGQSTSINSNPLLSFFKATFNTFAPCKYLNHCYPSEQNPTPESIIKLSLPSLIVPVTLVLSAGQHLLPSPLL